MTTPTPTLLMDEVHRATYNGIGIPGLKKIEGVRRVSQRYRQSLRAAQRFVLDDDAVKLICTLSHEKRRLDLWSVLARLPYDPMWIEFDLHTKIREWEKIGSLRHPFNPDDVSNRCGYLLQRDLDSRTRWIASEWVLMNGGAVPQPVSFVFDPEGSPIKPVSGSTLWNAPTLSKIAGFPRLPVSVVETPTGEKLYEGNTVYLDPEFAYSGDFDPGKNGNQNLVESAPWTHHKVGAIIEPVWFEAFKGIDKSPMNKIASEDVVERTGALRWLVVALATINDVPKVTLSKRGRPGHMQARANLLPYLDHHEVSITVPKGPRHFLMAARALTKAAVHAHRAWHRVRGHWRVIEYGKKLPIICRHEPTMVENGVAICERCERIIRWIEDHARGDPAIGIIDHSYRVET